MTDVRSLIDRLPFNWRTPLGYSFVLFYIYVLSASGVLAVGVVMVFFFGSCILLKSFIEDITNDLTIFKRYKTKREKRIFYNIIQAYTDIKQFSTQFLQKNKINFSSCQAN